MVELASSSQELVVSDTERLKTPYEKMVNVDSGILPTDPEYSKLSFVWKNISSPVREPLPSVQI